MTWSAFRYGMLNGLASRGCLNQDFMDYWIEGWMQLCQGIKPLSEIWSQLKPILWETAIEGRRPWNSPNEARASPYGNVRSKSHVKNSKEIQSQTNHRMTFWKTIPGHNPQHPNGTRGIQPGVQTFMFTKRLYVPIASKQLCDSFGGKWNWC